MAVRPSYNTVQLALEIAGVAAGPLRSVQPAPLRVERIAASPGTSRSLASAAAVSLGAMAAEFDLGDKGPLLDWVAMLWLRKLAVIDGAVLVADHDRIEQRRIGFSEGVLREVVLPTLSVADAKKAFTIALTWQPAQVDDQPGSGKKIAATVTKRKPLLTGNFRVLGLPFDGRMVREVGLPTARVALGRVDSRRPELLLAGFDGGELRLVVAGRSATEALAWVRKLVADGRIDAAEAIDIRVEMLDAALKSVLATIELRACALIGCEPSRLDSQADGIASVSLRFAVAETRLTIAG
ncbi:MAG: hypothetical protein JNL87_07620 [Burkholderiaceae bacterium]|nr:hypothetical protein [Burkholderiaceae bacterium]